MAAVVLKVENSFSSIAMNLGAILNAWNSLKRKFYSDLPLKAKLELILLQEFELTKPTFGMKFGSPNVATRKDNV
jgi:hypothetical protein